MNMNTHELTKILDNPAQLTEANMAELHAEMKKYPYFNTLHVVNLLYLAKSDFVQYQSEIGKSNIFITYPELFLNQLFSLQNGAKSPVTKPVLPEDKQLETNQKTQAVVTKNEDKVEVVKAVEKDKTELLKEERKKHFRLDDEQKVAKKQDEVIIQPEKKVRTEEKLPSDANDAVKLDEEAIKQIVVQQVEEIKRQKQNGQNIVNAENLENSNADDAIASVLEQVDRLKKVRENSQQSNLQEVETKNEVSAETKSDVVENVADSKITESKSEEVKIEESVEKIEDSKVHEAAETTEISVVTDLSTKTDEKEVLAEASTETLVKNDLNKELADNANNNQNSDLHNARKAIEFLNHFAHINRNVVNTIQELEKAENKTDKTEIQEKQTAEDKHEVSVSSEVKETSKSSYTVSTAKPGMRTIRFTYKTMRKTIVQVLETTTHEVVLNEVDPAETQKKPTKVVTRRKTEPDANKNVSNETVTTTTTTTVQTETTKQETKSEVTESKNSPETETPADRIIRLVAEKKKLAQPTKDTSDLIEKFLEQDNHKIDRNKPITDEGDKASKSVLEPEDLVSPTMAKLYVKQELYEKALETYEKLCLKYPEKKVYFAAEIEKIKEIIKNQ